VQFRVVGDQSRLRGWVIGMASTKTRSRKIVVLPRTEYARLHHYAGDRYVVDRSNTPGGPSAANFGSLRREAGLTRADVALGAKLPLETISRIDNGHGDPAAETTVRKLLRVIQRVGKASVPRDRLPEDALTCVRSLTPLSPAGFSSHPNPSPPFAALRAGSGRGTRGD